MSAQATALVPRQVMTEAGPITVYDDPSVGGTVVSMFWNRVAQWGPSIAMREKHLGIWQGVTWNAFGETVRRVALALDGMGFGKGDVACILSGTNIEWMYADLGILSVGGICAGIYPTDAAAQVEYLMLDSGSSIIFVEDEEQLDKVLTVRDRLPALRRIVVFDMEGLRDFADPMVVSFAAFLEEGAARLPVDRQHWSALLERAQPGDTAILVYTSGTTGPPKGAMISHHNILFQCINGTRTLVFEKDDERLAFLPLCHVAERVAGAYYSLYAGTISNFVESPETVPENIREVQPHVFGAVPRVWEKFYSTIMLALKDATPLQRAAYGWAIKVGQERAEAVVEGRPLSAGLKLRWMLAYHGVLKNLRRMIGLERVRWVFTGAAPISPDLIRWYRALGVEMLEVYGQTENAGLATANLPGAVKLGTVGRMAQHGELKISPQGEILLRGEFVFQGYWKKPELTAETVRDGWLHTGDVGMIDNEGFVRITDRMKDIIITAGGKNITPSEIENQLKFSPYISDAVVIGDRRKYLTALIMIDQENVEKFAQDNHVPFTNFTSLTRAQPVIDLIAAEVEAVNEKFARVETIKRFRLIEHQITAEDEEITPTLKLKRKKVAEKYREMIEAMYRDAA